MRANTSRLNSVQVMQSTRVALARITFLRWHETPSPSPVAAIISHAFGHPFGHTFALLCVLTIKIFNGRVVFQCGDEKRPFVLHTLKPRNCTAIKPIIWFMKRESHDQRESFEDKANDNKRPAKGCFSATQKSFCRDGLPNCSAATPDTSVLPLLSSYCWGGGEMQFLILKSILCPG